MTRWDYEALWLKAKLFLNRAMDDEPLRSFDEQAFWASQALELLGKAAETHDSRVIAYCLMSSHILCAAAHKV